MAADWPVLATAVGAALLGGGGIAGLVTAVAGRRTVKVDAVERLSGVATKLAEEMQKDLDAARVEAAQVRAQAADASRQLRLVQAEVDGLLSTLRRWRAAVLSPAVSREELRVMVRDSPGAGPGGNGTGAVV